MRHRLTVLTAILAVALGACAHGGRALRLPPMGPADSGKKLDLAVGQVITVRLPANLATGCRWEVATEPDPRVLIVTEAGYDRPAVAAPGADGQAWWKLRATGPGDTSIALRYLRPWAPGEDDREFALSVVVK